MTLTKQNYLQGGGGRIIFALIQTLLATPWLAIHFLLLCSSVSFATGHSNTRLESTTAVLPLNLTSVCSENPSLERRWRVTNPNAFPVAYTWKVFATTFEGSGIVSPGISHFFSPAVGGPNTTLLYWRDENNIEQFRTKASGGETCAPAFPVFSLSPVGSNFIVGSNGLIYLMGGAALSLQINDLGTGAATSGFTYEWSFDGVTWQGNYAPGSGHLVIAQPQSGVLMVRPRGVNATFANVASLSILVLTTGSPFKIAKYDGNGALGVAQMYESINGNVGIGTDVPKAPLQIGLFQSFNSREVTTGKKRSILGHNIWVKPAFPWQLHPYPWVENNTLPFSMIEQGENGIGFHTNSSTGSPGDILDNNAEMIISPEGNVGIKNNIPKAPLQIGQFQSFNSREVTAGNRRTIIGHNIWVKPAFPWQTHSYPWVEDNTKPFSMIEQGENGIGFHTSLAPSDIIDDNPEMIISPTGNLGIGISPLEKLHVAGKILAENLKLSGVSNSLSAGLLSRNADGDVITKTKEQILTDLGIAGAQGVLPADANKIVKYNASGNLGAARMQEDADGNVRIGTTGDFTTQTPANSGPRLYLNGGRTIAGTVGTSDNNSDPLFMERANLNMDHTAIRLNIGDDGGALKDMLDVGFYNYQPDPTGPYPWVSGIKLFSSGDLHVKNDIVGKTFHAQAPFNEEKGIWFSDGPSVGSWKISKEANSNDLTIGNGILANSIKITRPGNVGIGTTPSTPETKLQVKGNIVIEDGVGPFEKYSLRIGMLQPPTSSGHQDGKLLCAGKGVFHSLIVYDPATWITWPDFVFNNKYNLLSLAETEKFIETEKHLPGVPTEKEVNEKGFDVLEMNKILLQKIEEMTLHLIRLEKEVEALKIKK